MAKAKRIVPALLVIIILLGSFAWEGEKAAAQIPERKTTITVQITQYEWWLIRWSDNQITCRLLVDHEGLPTGDEVLLNCGDKLLQEWQSTPPCDIKDGQPTTLCSGMYLYLVSSAAKEKEVTVTLPPPTATVSLEGCNLSPPQNICPQLPRLKITGEEPLPNERITAVHGLYGGTPFTCEGDSCTIPLQPTPREGVTVEFWVDSSYGDSSEHFTAQVRVIDTGVSAEPGKSGWFVDVISDQWRGAELASCVRTWQAFPPLGENPDWLSTPERFELLSTDAPYYYLAGRLIAQGIVNAKDCPTGGLLPNGYADACGLEKARPMVSYWQNQFDERTIEVAKKTGVPAQLMKNLFAQESQFWPGVFRVPYEFGLGQITDNGAETILLWNPSFFAQFCPLVLNADACSRGYLHLQDEHKAILRGALAMQVKADCPTCPTGVDLSNVSFSVNLFANTLLANCTQVGQVVTNASEKVPGEVSSYEDLWRFTIANYHAGPGCLSYAIHTAWQDGLALTWENVATRFTEPCRGVVPYVEKITNVKVASGAVIAPTATQVTGTPIPLPTSIATATRTPGITPGITATPGPTETTIPYPYPVATETPTPYP